MEGYHCLIKVLTGRRRLENRDGSFLGERPMGSFITDVTGCPGTQWSILTTKGEEIRQLSLMIWIHLFIFSEVISPLIFSSIFSIY